MDGTERYTPVVILPGCRSTRLLTYLKALGLARILAQHGGQHIATRWVAPGERAAGSFAVGLRLSILMDTLLHQYRPSPVLSPWRADSPFAPSGDRSALEWLAANTDPRLAPYRAALTTTRQVLASLPPTRASLVGDAADLCFHLHSCLMPDARRWIRASEAQGLTRDNALVATLARCGRDVASLFLSAVQAIFDPNRGTEIAVLLRRSLTSLDQPLGANPWNVVLAVEGALTLASDDPLASNEPDRFGSPWWNVEIHEFWAPLWFEWTCYSALEPMLCGTLAKDQTGRQLLSALDVAMGLAAGEHYGVIDALECHPVAASVG